MRRSFAGSSLVRAPLLESGRKPVAQVTSVMLGRYTSGRKEDQADCNSMLLSRLGKHADVGHRGAAMYWN